MIPSGSKVIQGLSRKGGTWNVKIWGQFVHETFESRTRDGICQSGTIGVGVNSPVALFRGVRAMKAQDRTRCSTGSWFRCAFLSKAQHTTKAVGIRCTFKKARHRMTAVICSWKKLRDRMMVYQETHRKRYSVERWFDWDGNFWWAKKDDTSFSSNKILMRPNLDAIMYISSIIFFF